MHWREITINHEELPALLGDRESDRVERIESTKGTEKFAEAIPQWLTKPYIGR